MVPSKGGIFIKKSSFQEGVDFKVFFRPFRTWTWIVLIISSSLLALGIIIAKKVLDNGEITWDNAIRVALITTQANFGNGNFESMPNFGIDAPRVIFLTVLVMGNAIWISYNGSLLSGLITPNIIKPFNDLESLSKSNYRFIYSS